MELKKNQEALFKIFCEWETKYPVDEWQVYGVDLWPVLKKEIYYTFFRDFSTSTKKVSFLRRAVNKIVNFSSAWFYLKTKKFEQSDFLFSSAYLQRVRHEDKKINRLVEPIMDYLEKKGSHSYLLDFGEVEKEPVNKKHRVINLNILLPLFNKKINKTNFDKQLESLPGFQSLLTEVNIETGLKSSFLKNRLSNDVQSILIWKDLYSTLIKKTGAKYVVGVVYYTNALYGMNLAARESGTVSIDMQHGLQGILHSSYYYNKVSKEGYNILPNYFWTWDKASYDNIEQWSSGSFHKPLLAGNPWISFIKEDNSYDLETNRKKPIILFTLQPLNPIIPDQFLEVMKLTSGQYNWWLRFHPRMGKEEKEWVRGKLEEKNIKEVTIDKASNLPLPVALKICDLHISKSSGSIAEAAMMNKASLVISELGVISYDNLIKNNYAYSCLSRDVYQIIEQLHTVLKKSNQLDKQEKNIDFKDVIDGLLTRVN